jgi:hypothetical protein
MGAVDTAGASFGVAASLLTSAEFRVAQRGDDGARVAFAQKLRVLFHRADTPD